MADGTEPRDGWADGPRVETVADRLDRLEAAVAELRDTGRLEQSLTSKVLTRVRDHAAAAGLAPTGLAVGVGAIVPSGVADAVFAAAGGGLKARLAALREFRLMAKMYVDPRYRLSRVAQFGVPVLLGLMVLNYFFVGGAPLVGFLAERVVLVGLGVALYKVLAWEAARYDAVLKYLSQYG